MGVTMSRTRLHLHFHFSLSRNGEGNGNPLQCSCLENPRDGRAWWAAVCGVTQSRTRLKWLSSSSSRYYSKKHLWFLVDRSTQREASGMASCSVAKLCPPLHDPMDCSIPGLLVPHHLPGFTQTHVHWIQRSHSLSHSSPAFNLSQHQGLSHELTLHIR